MNEAREHLDELKELATDYIESRIELVKLKATEKVSRVIGVFLTLMILVVIFFLVLIAVSIVAGAYLNSVMSSQYAGFLLVAGVYSFSLVILLLKRKSVEQFFMSQVIRTIYKNDDTETGGS